MTPKTNNERDPVLKNLDPHQYQETARAFFKTNAITLSPSKGLSLIGEILEAFSVIPYENLSKIIKYENAHQDAASIRLPDEVWEDFRTHRLGGTCFSLTFLLQSIVVAAGFRCYPVMARMKVGENRHSAVVVEIDGDFYLLDPGYVLDIPIQILDEKRLFYKAGHAGVELRKSDVISHYHLFTFNKNGSQWRYEFENRAVDTHHFFQYWMGSFQWNGMNGLCLTRAHQDKLVYIHKYFMRETGLQGKKNFNLKKNREEVIQSAFGIAPEIVEAAEAAIQGRRQRSKRTE